MSFFDQFRQKFDPQKGPVQSAVEYLHTLLSPWTDGDEGQLTAAISHEQPTGWGGLDELGLLYATDGLARASFVSNRDVVTGTFNNKFDVRLLVCTQKEAFSFLADASRALVYYGNQPIGAITIQFGVFNMQGQQVMLLYPRGDYIVNNAVNAPVLPVDLVNGVAPTPFRLYSGLCGYFNIPPDGQLFSLEDQQLQTRAIGLLQNQPLPTPEERMWILAAYFFLRLGPYSTVGFPPERIEGLLEETLEFFFPTSGSFGPRH